MLYVNLEEAPIFTGFGGLLLQYMMRRVMLSVLSSDT